MNKLLKNTYLIALKRTINPWAEKNSKRKKAENVHACVGGRPWYARVSIWLDVCSVL